MPFPEILVVSPEFIGALLSVDILNVSPFGKGIDSLAPLFACLDDIVQSQIKSSPLRVKNECPFSFKTNEMGEALLCLEFHLGSFFPSWEDIDLINSLHHYLFARCWINSCRMFHFKFLSASLGIS